MPRGEREIYKPYSQLLDCNKGCQTVNAQPNCSEAISVYKPYSQLLDWKTLRFHCVFTYRVVSSKRSRQEVGSPSGGPEKAARPLSGGPGKAVRPFSGEHVSKGDSRVVSGPIRGPSRVVWGPFEPTWALPSPVQFGTFLGP